MVGEIVVRDPYYPTECESCGWFGSSASCGTGDYFAQDDIICPQCGASMCGNEPSPQNMKHFKLPARYRRIPPKPPS
jgi:hypothetical protein